MTFLIESEKTMCVGTVSKFGCTVTFQCLYAIIYTGISCRICIQYTFMDRSEEIMLRILRIILFRISSYILALKFCIIANSCISLVNNQLAFTLIVLIEYLIDLYQQYISSLLLYYKVITSQVSVTYSKVTLFHI